MSTSSQQGSAASQHESVGSVEEQGAEVFPLVELHPEPAPSTADAANSTDPGRHVTTRRDWGAVSELTSLLKSLYLESRVEDSRPAEEAEDAALAGLAQRIQELQLCVDDLDLRLREAVDSTLNQEKGLRVAIQSVGKESKEYVDLKLQKHDQIVVDCLRRRDRGAKESPEQRLVPVEAVSVLHPGSPDRPKTPIRGGECDIPYTACISEAPNQARIPPVPGVKGLC